MRVLRYIAVCLGFLAVTAVVLRMYYFTAYFVWSTAVPGSDISAARRNANLYFAGGTLLLGAEIVCAAILILRIVRQRRNQRGFPVIVDAE